MTNSVNPLGGVGLWPASSPLAQQAERAPATSSEESGPKSVITPPKDAETARPVSGAEEAASTSALGSSDLSEEEEAVVEELKARDREVRAHEEAHKRVGGQYAGAISYTYQVGPDGVRYAVGGSVPIDVAPEQEPEDTIRKMEVVVRAALAPVEPSAQDQAVAAQARAQMAAAQAQIATEGSAPSSEADGEDETGAALVTALADRQQAEGYGDALKTIRGTDDSRSERVNIAA